MSELQADPYVGLTLQDRYHLVECLGEGAMGVVYLGRDSKEQRTVAIKMLHETALERDPSQNHRLVERFKREIETTKKLRHPNIVAVVADGEADDGMPYVVLEYLEGWDLRDVLEDETKLTPERAARVGLSIALALEESHGLGIVHRDLKPENVFLVQRANDEVVKVLDFGIARGTDEDQERLTIAGTALGTPRYMAPEQVTDSGLTPKTDIYSLGVMLFEMLSGDIPFWSENELDLALMHVSRAPAKLDIEGMEIELLARWRDLVGKLLRKRPEQRPTARLVATHLATLHAMALRKAEVHPDKDTQILRMDVAKARNASLSRSSHSRPTRVLGVRTTRSGSVLVKPTGQEATDLHRDQTRRVPTHILTLAQSRTIAASQRATTDQLCDDGRAHAPMTDANHRAENKKLEAPPPNASSQPTTRSGTQVAVAALEPLHDAPAPTEASGRVMVWAALGVLLVLAAALLLVLANV